MKNPFDQTFFRFLLGFTLILAMSFAILFFVGQYKDSLEVSNSASTANLTDF